MKITATALNELSLSEQNWFIHSQLAAAALKMFDKFSFPQLGTGQARWKRVYRMIRAQASSGNSLFQWSTRHNPFMEPNQIGVEISQEQAMSMKWGVDTDKPVGTVEVKPVAVCSTRRIVCDPITKYVFLECVVCETEPGTNRSRRRFAVRCPRYPVTGIHPGVWAGVPVIASHSMQPRKD